MELDGLVNRQRNAVVLAIGIMCLPLGAYLGATGDSYAGPVLVIGVLATLSGVWELSRPRR